MTEHEQPPQEEREEPILVLDYDEAQEWLLNHANAYLSISQELEKGMCQGRRITVMVQGEKFYYKIEKKEPMGFVK